MEIFKDSLLGKNWKNTNSKKTSHTNIFKIQSKMALGITNIMAFSKSSGNRDRDLNFGNWAHALITFYDGQG